MLEKTETPTHHKAELENVILIYKQRTKSGSFGDKTINVTMSKETALEELERVKKGKHA